jgi:glycosyltransferase involved in cell wall biosynthesis
MVPLYLPLLIDADELRDGVPVFFGGINVYLQQRFRLFRQTPRWIDWLLDIPWMLRRAAAREGATSAADLGPMTLSMLQGRDGNQRKELNRLTAWLAEQQRPDVIHVSNALLLGVAGELKQTLKVPVVCSLQDEHGWLDAMLEPYRRRCWEVIAEKAQEVDAFVAVSHWYAGQICSRIGIPPERIAVAPAGIELDDVEPAAPVDPPVIGYLSRMGEPLGLGLLVDAFVQLKKDPELRKLRLRVTGGQMSEDRPFLAELRKRLREQGLEDHVEFVDDFHGSARHEFLRSLSVLSVPVMQGEAFGTFIIEALAAGVPVVQPAVGAFPEIVETTGGGIIYDPENEGALTEALRQLLLDAEHAQELGRRGREVVLREYSVERATDRILAVYESVKDEGRRAKAKR